MTVPQIHGNSGFVTASEIRKALGDELGLIRQQDELTWVDLGDILGKSDDQAAKYADGSAEMGVVAYYRAKARWNGRFTRKADELIAQGRHQHEPDQTRQSKVLKAALALSVALEDGAVDLNEIIVNRATLEAARDAIDGLLARLAPKAARK